MSNLSTRSEARLPARYATALFQLSKESGSLDEIFAQSEFLCTTFRDTDALKILTNPLIAGGDKVAFIDKAFGDVLNQDLISFLKLTVAKNREAFILPALTRLIYMIKLHKNQITARVVSAIPLSDEQKVKLAAALSAKLNKQVDLNVLIDPAQIAGISIQVDGYFLDRTVKTMLKNMNESLKEGMVI